jgi:hypothetical protein
MTIDGDDLTPGADRQPNVYSRLQALGLLLDGAYDSASHVVDAMDQALKQLARARREFEGLCNELGIPPEEL